MTDEEFRTFLNSANAELRQKQVVLKGQYGLGSPVRWWFEQATGKLQFFDSADKLAIETDVIDIGSYSPNSNSWKWAWSNDTVLPWLRHKAEKLKELEAITGLALFGLENAFAVEGESMAWELTAIGVRHLKALGCYKAPSSEENGPTTFLAIMAIKLA
jgi:hypothetical protein